MLGFKPRLSACKPNALPTVLSLRPLEYISVKPADGASLPPKSDLLLESLETSLCPVIRVCRGDYCIVDPDGDHGPVPPMGVNPWNLTQHCHLHAGTHDDSFPG